MYHWQLNINLAKIPENPFILVSGISAVELYLFTWLLYLILFARTQASKYRTKACESSKCGTMWKEILSTRFYY